MFGATYDYLMASESDWSAAREQLRKEGVTSPTPAELYARKEKIARDRS